MCDLVSPTIRLINACISQFTEFCAFKDECATFRQSLCNVREVLEDVQREITAGLSKGGNTRLRRPMELLQAATIEGGDVLRKCSAKRTLQAFVFSRQLMGMLNKAKADIEEAMRLLQVSSVRIQVSTRRVMDCVSGQLVELHKQINASYTSKNEVADLIRAEMKQHRESQGESIATAVSDVLVKMGVVSSAQDFTDQLAELKREADSIRKAKVIYDEEMLEAVKALTAPQRQPQQQADTGAVTPPGLSPTQRQGSEASSAVQECMICPISGDIMRDPVTVVESGLTYDRESLCTSLLLYPDLEPGTGQRYDRPLNYTPSIVARNLIMAQHGDSQFQRYDDAEFKVQYEAKWNELACPPPSVITVTNDQDGTGGGSCTSFDADAGSVLTDPTSATTAQSGGSGSRGGGGGGNPGDLGGFNAPGDGEGGSESALVSPKAGSPGIKFGDSEETTRNDTLNSHAADNDAAEAAKPSAATRRGDTLRACWRSRRARWMVAGAILIVLAVIVGIVVGASKRGPASPSSGNPSASPTTAPSTEPILPSSPASQPTPPPTMTPAEKFTSTLPPYTIESLQNTSSPQYRAYEMATQSDQIPEGDEATTLFRMTQRFALATLLYSLRLDSWIMPSESECDWGDAAAGSNVTCNADSAIAAFDANRAGNVSTPIPREIGLLTTLASLRLGWNNLTSSIPTELGQLTNLEHLDLQFNFLASSIPTEVGQLASLSRLYLQNNALTSSIPTEMGQMSALTELILWTNSLSSSIPTEMGQLSDLTFLNLVTNSLSSSIPTELGRLSALTGLHLHSNFLASSIPTELGQLSALKTLYLFGNSLTSSVPSELARLTELGELRLQDNLLTGTFPSALCSVESVRIDCSEIVCSCCSDCISA